MRISAIWGAVLVALLLAFVGSRRLSARLLAPLPHLPGALGRLGGRLAPRLSEALDGLRELTAARRLVWPTLLSVGAWALEGLGLFPDEQE
jgi:hypothetical protein